jgi:hypothetical protein
MAGACFGIPFALLILQQLVDNQSRLNEQRRTLLLFRQVLGEMQEASRHITVQSPKFPGGSWAPAVDSAFSSYRMPSTLSFRELIENLRKIMLTQLGPEKSADDLLRSLYEYRSAWGILSGTIKIRLAEAEIPWLVPQESDINATLRLCEQGILGLSEASRVINDLEVFFSAATRPSSGGLAPTEENKKMLGSMAARITEGLNSAKHLPEACSTLSQQVKIISEEYGEHLSSSMGPIKATAGSARSLHG